MYASSNNFQILSNQIAQQLELLGYKAGEKVFLRAFYPSDDPRKAEDKGRKGEATTVELIAQAAETFQSNGRGVYFVVNGSGQKDAEVKACRAIFYEHDNLSKELQRDLWRSLGLPEPTFQIDTGGKSIHSYWVFDQPINPTCWRTLQADLLEFADADRSLKNLSRVMRLAGCYHLSAKGAYPTVIVSASGTRYSYSSLRAIVPTQQKTPSPSLPLSTFTDNVPLAVCLSKSDRSLVHSGSGQGERNTNGAKLARNLIGTSCRLQYLGIQHSGSPRQLFDDYCDRCSPPLNTQEADQIWKSALAANPTATLSDDAILNCVKAWQRKQITPSLNVENTQQKSLSASKIGSVTGDSANFGDTYNQDSVRFTATVTSVTEILNLGFTDYEEQQLLEDVCKESGFSKGAFWKLVNSQKNKIDALQPSDEIRLDALINWSDNKLDLNKALPSMAPDIQHDADVLNIDPILIWQSLMPAVLSQVGKEVKLDVGSHKIPCIGWTISVAESGGGKTRADNLVLSPLRELQKEYRQLFQSDLKDWEKTCARLKKGKEAPEKPVEHKAMFEVATIQAVMRRASEQGDGGQLWCRDELAGLFKSFGQFGKSENEGLECLLKLWDGSPVQVDRVHQEDSFYINETAISVSGGLQPGIYRDIFKDPKDSQGLTARFLIATAKQRLPKRVKGHCDLSEKLPHLYRWLREIPDGTITLSTAADNYYDKLYEQIGTQAYETSQPAIRAWMIKLMGGNLLRIALALHFLECYHDQNKPIGELQKDTLQRAVLFAQYYRSAFHVLQETTVDNDDITSILFKIWDTAATRHPDGITTRDAYRTIKAIQYRAKDMGRDISAYTAELFGMLSAKGKGKVIKNGRTIKFIALIGTDPDPNITSEMCEFDVRDPEGASCREAASGISKSENTNIGDTVTIPETPAVHELELSPLDQVSPVTVPNSAPILDDTLTSDLWASEPPLDIHIGDKPEVAIHKEADLKDLLALIFQCKVWVDFAELVGSQEKIVGIVDSSTQRQINYLVRLFRTYLVETNNVNDLIWLPEKLVKPTLSQITFTVTRRKLGSQEIEVIHECQMVNIKSETQKSWTFSAPGIPILSIHNVEDFAVESLTLG
jgi:hypothetical protein